MKLPYLKTVVYKFNLLPFRGSKPIVSPTPFFERRQILVGVSGETEIINGLGRKVSTEGEERTYPYELTFWIANADSRQWLILPHQVRTQRRSLIGLS